MLATGQRLEPEVLADAARQEIGRATDLVPEELGAHGRQVTQLLGVAALPTSAARRSDLLDRRPAPRARARPRRPGSEHPSRSLGTRHPPDPRASADGETPAYVRATGPASDPGHRRGGLVGLQLQVLVGVDRPPVTTPSSCGRGAATAGRCVPRLVGEVALLTWTEVDARSLGELRVHRSGGAAGSRSARSHRRATRPRPGLVRRLQLDRQGPHRNALVPPTMLQTDVGAAGAETCSDWKSGAPTAEG